MNLLSILKVGLDNVVLVFLHILWYQPQLNAA